MNTIKIHSAKVNCSPEEVFFKPKKIELLDNLFSELISNKKLQGASYLLARHGKIFAHKSMGNLSYKENSNDLMPDSIRRIASTTKFYTAVAVMQLIENGKLSIDQSAASLISEFDNPQHRGINIWHLLTHTSGLGADPGYFNETYPKDWKAYEPGENWIKAALTGPMLCAPGEQWNYYSTGFSFLGEIISRVSDISYDEYIIKNIIEPLGMERTFFDIPSHLSDEICFVSEPEEKFLRSSVFKPKAPPRAGGGLYSSLHDMWIMGQTIINNGVINDIEILSRKSIELMSRNHLHNVFAYCWGSKIKNMPFGLGMSLDTRDILTNTVFGHEGAGRCGLWLDPTESFVVAFFVPTTHDWVPESLVNSRNIMWSGLI